MSQDLLVASYKGALKRSKNLSYKTQVQLRYSSLIRFLQEGHLLKVRLVDDYSNLPEDLEIRKSVLTDEGWELMHLYYDKWLGAIDRGRDPNDTQILAKGLAKIRQSNQL